MSTAKKIYREVLKLPESLAQEVLDFVEYIEQKHGIRDDSIGDLISGQSPTMEEIWSNSDDDIWDDV